MQIQEATKTDKPAADAAPPARITFDGTREIRRAMVAARTSMGNRDDDDPRWNPSCRLTARPGATEIEILATDGQCASRVRVAARRTRRDEALDVPLKTALVRAIARTRAAVLTIETDGETTRVIGSDGADERFAATNALQASTIRRPLDRPRTGAVVRDMPRTAALRALRAMPPQKGRICRMSIGPNGVRAWATNADLVGPDYAADAKLAAHAERCHEEVVFGIDRSILTAALRTMTGTTLSLHVEAHNQPIVLSAKDGRETVAIATRRLG